MGLVAWAKNELDMLVGDGDDGTQAAINEDILEIVKVFASQRHSDLSASYTLGILKRLLSWKPITPLTGEDAEWDEVFDSERKTQQNKRCSAVFRDNFDNSTARYIYGKVFSDDGGKTWFTNCDSSVHVTFPFNVPDKPEYVILGGREDVSC